LGGESATANAPSHRPSSRRRKLNLLRALKVAAERARLAGVSVHTLRHSAASALLEKGIGLKTVSEMLGHSGVAITGDIYQHVSDGAAQAAADALAAAIGV
jgi:site-specific recombinase XerD